MVLKLVATVDQLLFNVTYLGEQLIIDTEAFSVSLVTLEPEENALTRVNLAVNGNAFSFALPPDAFSSDPLVNGDDYQVEVCVQWESSHIQLTVKQRSYSTPPSP